MNNLRLFMSAYMYTPQLAQGRAHMVISHFQQWSLMSLDQMKALDPTLESTVVENLHQIIDIMCDSLRKPLELQDFLRVLSAFHSWHDVIWKTEQFTEVVLPEVMTVNMRAMYDYRMELEFQFAWVRYFCELIVEDPEAAQRFYNTLAILAKPLEKGAKGDIGIRAYCNFVLCLLRDGKKRAKSAYEQAIAFNSDLAYMHRRSSIEAYWCGAAQEQISLRVLSWREVLRDANTEPHIRSLLAALRWT